MSLKTKTNWLSVLFVVFALISASWALAEPPDHAGKPNKGGPPLKNNRIAYIRDGDLWVMDGDGSGHTQLTSGQYPVRAHSWKPDGTQIAFTRIGEPGEGYEIYSIKPNGKFETNLTNDPADDWNPKWSPDGTKILFERNDGTGHFQIWMMNADGSAQTSMAYNSYNDGRSPAWNPDGSQVAFVGDGHLWVMQATGGGAWPDIYYKGYPPLKLYLERPSGRLISQKLRIYDDGYWPQTGHIVMVFGAKQKFSTSAWLK